MSAEMQREREQFEAWARTREGHPFAGQFLNLMWAAWQAARRSQGQEWISVDSRLPKERDNVLVCHRTDTDGVPDLSVTVGRLDNDGWKVAATFYNLRGASQGRPFEMRETRADVAFWMPLPAAPSGEVKE